MNNFDWKYFFVILSIYVIGILSLYSVTYQQGYGAGLPIYAKQVIWGGIGFTMFFFFSFVDYKILLRLSYFIYFIILLLLVYVFFRGRIGMGAQRWISFGGLHLQPSELAKVGLILFLAKYFQYIKRNGMMEVKTLFIPTVLSMLYFVLILKQPDLGTALVVFVVFISTVFLVGYKFRYGKLIILFSLLATPFFGKFAWRTLKGYQKKRILMFLNPSADPLGSGYHILQSKISIGSGGLTGKGLMGGTQTQLKFLPEGHTDFIFAAFSEEWGFVGVIVLVSLYLCLLFYSLDAAVKSKDVGGMILTYGFTIMLFFHIIVNIGMTLAVLPVVGVPLPLMSYGGTFLVTTLGCLGIIHNIRMRRFKFGY